VETINAVWRKVYMLKNLSKEEGNIIVEVLRNDIMRLLKIYNSRDYFLRAFEISLSEGITIYDSLYIALAEGEGISLLTSDKKQYKKRRKYVNALLIE